MNTESDNMVTWLLAHRDDGTVKVLTGLRGTGKSTAVDVYRHRLEESGVNAANIITIDFASSIYRQLRTPRDILDCIDAYTLTDDRYYVFIDEPLDAEGFGALAERLRSRANLDLAVISSNRRILSELNGHVSAYEVRGEPDGFPHLEELKRNRSAVKEYCEGLWGNIFLSDVLTLDKAIDCRLMEHIAEYLALHLGEPVSLRQIGSGVAEASRGRVASASTISEYFTTLLDSHLFARAMKFDIFSHEVMTRGYRVFSPCPGLLSRRFGPTTSGNHLRNLVWNVLRRKWKDVFTGRTPNSEIDFVTRNGQTFAYFQTADAITSEQELEKVAAPLHDIDRTARKTIVTMKPCTLKAPTGIHILPITTFIKGNN